MHKKPMLVSAVVLVVVALGAWLLLSVESPTRVWGPQPEPEVAVFNPKVAGISTARQTTKLPFDKPISVVVSDGQNTKVVASAPTANLPEGVPAPTQPDMSPPHAPPKEQTVVINLRGPLTATLLPGQRTPVLTYELTDNAQFEWFPGELAGWIDTPKEPDTHVWSTMLERQPSKPYIGSYLHFFIAADKLAQPGTHKVSVKLRLTPNVVLGVPVMVTVPHTFMGADFAAQPG